MFIRFAAALFLTFALILAGFPPVVAAGVSVFGWIVLMVFRKGKP